MLRLLAVATALAVACFLLIAFGLFPQSWLRVMVEGQIRSALGPGSRIGHLHVVPGRLRAVATDVVIEGRGYRLETPRLALSLALPTVLGRALALRSLEMQEPVLTVWPVEPLGEKTEPAPLEQSVLVGSIDIRRGTFIYADPAAGGDWRVEDVRLVGGIGKDQLRLDTGPVRWERPEPLVFEPIHAVASLTPTLQTTLESLEIGTARSRLTASGAVGELMRPDLDLRVAMRLDLADAALVTGTSRGTGIVTGEMQLHGTLPELVAKGRLQGRGLVLDGRRIDSADLSFERAGPRTSAELDAAAFGGRVRARARLDGTAIETSGRAVEIDLARAGAGLPGRATLDFKAQGTLRERLAVSARVEARGRAPKNLAFTARATAEGTLHGADYRPDLRWSATGTADQPVDPAGAPSLQGLTWSAEGTATRSWPPLLDGRFEGNGRFVSASVTSPFRMNGTLASRGAATSASAVLTGDLGRVNVEATMAASGTTTFDIAGQDVRLERFLRDTGGVARFAFKGQQRAGVMAGSGQGSIAGLTWSGASFGTVTVEARAEKDTTRATFRIPDLRATADATLAPARRGSRKLMLTARVELQDTPLAPFSPLAGTPLAGHVGGRFEIGAPLDALASARIEGRLEAAEIRARRLQATLQAPTRLVATQRRLDVEGLAVAGPGFELKASGAIGLAPGEPHDARVEGTVDLATVPAPVEWQLGGQARADLRVQGTRTRPLAYGSVDLTQLAAVGPRLPPLAAETARLELAGESLRIAETEASFAGGRIRVNGIVPLGAMLAGTRPEAAHIDVVWNGVDAAQIHLAVAPDAEVAVNGVLEGEAHVAGAFTSMAAITARVRTPPLRLTVEQVPITLSGLTLDIASGKATLAPLQVSTPNGSVQIRGRADLTARTLNGSATGSTDLRAFSPLMTNAALTGLAELDVTVSGSFDDLRPRGHVVMKDATLRMRDLQPAVTEITGTIELDGTHLKIPGASASWGGGPVTLSGTAGVHRSGLTDARFEIKGQEMALEYLGARMLASADLTFTGRSGDLRLAGNVTLRRGLYQEDLFLDQRLRAPEVEDISSPFLRTIALNLRVTTGRFQIDNNIAENVILRGSLSIRGTADEPAPFGSLTVDERGTIRLQHQQFTMGNQREGITTGGTLTFNGSFFPDLELYASSELKWVEENEKHDTMIGVKITGNLENPTVRFTGGEDAGLTQLQVASIIATGRPEPDKAGLVGVAGGVLGSHLSKDLSEKLGLGGLGFDEVTIEPSLMAKEQSDWGGARLTFGKHVTAWTRILYSFGLEDTEEPFFRVEVEPINNVLAVASRRADGTATGGVQHRLQIGAPRRRTPASTRGDQIEIRAVRIDGGLPVEEKVARGWAGVSAGDKRTIWDLQDAADRLQRGLAEQGHIEAQVLSRVDERTAIFVVRAGPRYEWRVEGMIGAPDLTGTVRGAFYAEAALAAATERVLRTLRDRGHLRAAVQTSIEGDEERRTLVLKAEPGPVYAGAAVEFPGARALSHRALLRAAGGPGELLTEPARARRRIVEAYQKEFHLQAKVAPPQVEETGSTLRIRVPVTEGELALIRVVSFAGHTIDENELRRYTGDLVGAPPDELRAARAVRDIGGRYFDLGYPDVRVSSRLLPSDDGLEMRLEIAEGEQVHVREIVFQGETRVPISVLRKALPFKVGDPLDPRKLTRAEARLSGFELGRVRVSSDEKDPARVVVDVRRSARVLADYEVNIDTHSAPGLAVEVRAPNLLPGGISPSIAGLHQQHLRRVRGNIRMPSPLHRGMLNVSLSREDAELDPVTGELPRPAPHGVVAQVARLQAALLRRRGADPLVEALVDRSELVASVLQNTELGGLWQIQYGYELKRQRNLNPGLFLPSTRTNGILRLSLVRDTRDHLLDARRGRFWSLSLSYTPPVPSALRDTPFMKGFGQLSVYRPLTDSFTWAHSYQLGAGRGIRTDDGPTPRLYFSERFKAGGPNSLRGFATDTVGPREGFTGLAAGDMVVVLNQELRYHHRTGLGAAVFYDAGNIYTQLSDFDWELRHSVGFGLRYSSPVGLFRADFGVPLNPRPDDRRYQVFLSLGQAF